MTYIFGQILGVIGTILCVSIPVYKKKWQMLAAGGCSNLCFALNLLLIGQPGSAMLINLVSVVPVLLSLRHLKKGTSVSRNENIFFLCFYVAFGLVGFSGPVDVLPIIGAVFNVLATFQRDEQKTRALMLCNLAPFTVYYLLVGSSSILAGVFTIITTIVSMVKYRRKG